MATTTQDLDALFPLPSLPPSALSPTPGPGITRESAEALVRLLKENHTRFHCFFNHKGYHNHLSHHIFAAFFLGATPPLLEAVFEANASYQRAAYSSPSPIDSNNWKDHLGNEDYYKSYLAFFSSELINNGLETTFEKFFFTAEANWGNNENDDHPQMLSRLLAGSLHPLIYAGHGMEFGQLGMVAEGFAQAACHKVPTSKLISREFLAPTSPSSLTAGLMSRVTLKSTTVQKPSGTHPFSILARMLKDERLAPEQPSGELEQWFENTLNKRGEVIRGYAELWDADTSSPAAVSQRVEELAWVAALLYGVGGWKKDRPFQADFFIMHLVTSSIFIPSTLAHLGAESKRLFLRSYFAVMLGYWVSQGRPRVDIKSFYDGTTTDLVAPGPKPTPNPETLDKEHLTPNAWYPLLQSTLMHPSEHLLKLERALAHYAALYGATPSKHFTDTELEDADILDGTVFLRAGWLSLERHGWMREGKEKGDWDFADWDFAGFFAE